MAPAPLGLQSLGLIALLFVQGALAAPLVVDAAEPVQVQVPAPPVQPPQSAGPYQGARESKATQGMTEFGSTQPVAVPPPEPAFDPESREGSQTYEAIYTRPREEPRKPKPPLPKHRALVGDFTKDAVEVNIGRDWYRLPRSLFAKVPSLAPGEEVNVRMSKAQLERYRMKRPPRKNPAEAQPPPGKGR
ncbi:MAG: hypothetical protein IT285_12565 [Bdellovibrionales bacterium]|nr:hypothetical protein [Bdellovibrionales bacterium]